MQCDCHFCPILSKIGKLWQILIKSPNIELHENSERGSYAVPCGQTDGHDEDSSHLSQPFENEKKLSQTFTVPKKRTKEEVTSQSHGALNLISSLQKLIKRNNYTSFVSGQWNSVSSCCLSISKRGG